MATNQDLKGQKLMVFEAFVNDFSLGLLADEEVKISIDGNVVKNTNALSGKATTKAWGGGVTPMIEMTLTEIHKFKIQRMWNYMLKNRAGEATTITDGDTGTLEITGLVGDCLQPVVLTLYAHHTLCETNTRFDSNNLNPLGFQLLRAICPDMLEWAFKSDSTNSYTIKFEGMPDFDLPNSIFGYIGYVNLPKNGLHILNTGTGFTTATFVYGVPFVASAVATLNTLVTVSTRIYRVTTGGTMSATAPVHTTGSVVNGSATLQFVGVHPTFTIGVVSGKLSPESVVLTAPGTSVPLDFTLAITGGTGAIARLLI